MESEELDTVYSLFLTLALHYMRSKCFFFPEMSTHQTLHLILSPSNIKYMLLDNKFSEKKLKIRITLPFINKTCNE